MTAPLHAIPTQDAAAPRAWRRVSMRAALIGFVTCVLLGVAALAAMCMVDAQREAMEQGRSRMDNLTRAFAEHTLLTLQGADQVLRFIRREYLQQGPALDIGAHLQHGDVLDTQFHLLTVVGADGMVLSSSQPFQRVSLRDREHFAVHARDDGERLFISKPLVGRVSGKTSIQVTRRATDAHGRFAGVVVMSLAPLVFTRFQRQPGEVHGDLLLAGLDGIVRARVAGTDREVGQNIGSSVLLTKALEHGSGSVVTRSPIDGLERLYVYRTLEPYGLVVFSGMRTELLLQQARQRQLLVGAAAVGAGATLLAFLALMLRAERRHQATMAQLRENERQARSANESSNRFLRSISHELRMPLNGILGFSELIRDTSTDPEAREFGAIVRDSAERLHGLLSSLMDLAKIESGRLGLQPEAVELPALLHELVQMHRRSAEGRGLALGLYIAPDAARSVVTDRLRLLQVLNHLMTNALKFTERGRVRLSLVAQSDGVLIQVQDSGIGMTPAQLRALFDHFDTAAADYGHCIQGPGLGLPLARGLAQLLGGSLHIESTEGEGTLARLCLPLAPPSTAQASPHELAAALPSPPSITHAAAPHGAHGRNQRDHA